MTKTPSFACMGRPLLLAEDGDPIPVKTRKALAIIGYLSRSVELSVSRNTLSDVLWSGADRHKALQSLRQALRLLKTAEESVGRDIIISTNSHIHLNAAVFFTDLDQLFDLIKRGTATDFVEAKALWRGDFLAGFEDLDPEFAEWLLVERERVSSAVTSEIFKHLDSAAVEAGRDHVENAARLLLHLDPALESAHQVLIRFHLAQGQKERAEQQFKACERELKLYLDGEPNQDTRALLSEGHGGGDNQMAVVRQPGEFAVVPATPADIGDQIILPSISIVSSQLNSAGLTEAFHLKEEIVAGLSSYRAFDLFHAEYFGNDEASEPVLVHGDELGSYLLRFRYNERNEKIAVQFEDRADGRIVFNEIVDLNQWESVQAAASQTISRIHIHAIGRLKNPKNSAAFAKWCQAEALMWDFNPQSDRKALQLLNELERQHASFSMVFSGKALINMKQLVCYPIEDRELGLGLEDILTLCEQAVMLDPWQPLNQRAYGWALIQSNMADQAKKAFMHAGRLNSVDPANLMSVAEGLAYAGEVTVAKEKADLAMSLFTSVPRVFYEYYSNVYFAAEDFETAAKLIERASYTSVSPLTTRIAALVCAGKESEAIEVLKRHRGTYADTIQKTGFGQGDLNEWASKVNFFQEPRTRNNYEKGVDLVRRFFFGDLASAN